MVRHLLFASLLGFMLGVLVVAGPPLVSLRIAAVESQYIYDCGLRVA